MAAFEPFEPNTASTAGKTINAPTGATTTSASVVVSVTVMSPVVLVANLGATNAFIRLSAESAPTATQADIPLPANSVRLYANPVPTGNLGVATVGVTVSNTMLYVCPGQGGI